MEQLSSLFLTNPEPAFLNKKTRQEPFAWPVRVYYEDTDAQGLVYYANYFKFMERARTEWLRSLGVEQDALMRDERRIFVVVDTRADFLEPARFNEELMVTAGLEQLTRASFQIVQDIFRNSTDGPLLCRGRIRAALLNADTLKPVRVPASLFEGSPP
jgi:acyl-CoA thioester hydrolase